VEGISADAETGEESVSELALQGYQIIPNVLSFPDIVAMREAITETIDRVAAALRAPLSMSCPDASFEDRVDQIAVRDRGYALAIFRAVMADAQRDPRIEALVGHERMTSVVQDLLSPMQRTGQVIRPRAVVHAFSTARHPWHQDVVRPTTTGCGSVRFACWIPLTEVNERSGALEIIPGAWSEPFPHEVHADGALGILENQLPATDRRSIPLKPGDVLVLDRYTPHRSLPVEPGKARWAVAMWVKGSG
jgi:ectoine hydroxylase-related dioxygenase (phytanoyl-CoA dioxygenase family)